jgi:hypothetical protein
MSGKPEDPIEARILQRNTAATAFVGFLIGLAYQEAIAPVRTSIIVSGITFVTSAIFITFFLLGLATFIACYYSLILGAYGRLAWLVQFAMFAIESVVLIFMGGVASADASARARYGFVDLLFLYVTLGTVWSLATLAWTLWKRRPLTGRLAPFSAVTVWYFTVVLLVQLLADDRYGRRAMAVLAGATALRTLAVLVIFWRQRLL